MDPASLKTSDKNTNSPTDPDKDYDNFDPKTDKQLEKDKYIERIKGQFRYDLLAHDNYIQNFDAYEAMLISRPYDSVSKKIQSGLSDGRTTTIYQERAARVCGQLASGNMQAAGKKDTGASLALDIIRQKYMLPNANAQAPLLEKYRNWQFYSSVYGFMPMFYDWDTPETGSQNGYVGPNCWLWHPRNFIPQLGRSSIEDMEYCNAITYAGAGYLKDLLDEPEDAGWDGEEVKNLLDLIEGRTRMPDNMRDSLVTRERQSQADKGRIMLATRYESGADGNWVVFAPEYNGIVIRTIRNPHKNGKIPFIIKYATPLFDNFYGLGDFQRAKPLQFASDGLDNFYFAGIKRGLYPPTIVNPAGVVKSSITQDPGAIWQETVANSIREYKTQPVGLTTYQAAKTMMNGSLLNQAGTSDISQTATGSTDPTISKTPQGVNAQSQKESARDNQDRFYLESRIEQLEDRMMGLFGTIGTEDIPVDLFVQDFKDIAAAGWGDELKEMLDISESKQSARMTIKPSFFNKLAIRFKIDPNSTAAADKLTQLTSLENFMKNISSMQNEVVDMKAQGWTIDWSLVAKLEEQLSDVPEMGKIFRQMTDDEKKLYAQQQQAANPQKGPENIDTTAFKDLPAWARPMWLQKQGYTPPQTQDGTPPTMLTPTEELKTTEAAVKMHSAAGNSPEVQAAAAPPPAAPPAGPPPDQPVEPAIIHNGRQLTDPVVAAAHKKIGELAHAPAIR